MNRRPMKLLMVLGVLVVLPGCLESTPGVPGLRENCEVEPVEGPEEALPAPWDFEGALFTGHQAERGGILFEKHCSACHLREHFAGVYFQYRWNGATVAYLYRFMTRQMPRDAPGRLAPEVYAAILAFVLRENGLAAGEKELSAETLNLEEYRFELRDSGG